jgi:hypothetical protein
MSRAVARNLISTAFVALLVSSAPSRAWAAWTCEAESPSGSATGIGASRKEAEDRALSNCAGASARFAICRIYTCHRGR